MSEKEIYLKERDVYMPEDSKVTETDQKAQQVDEKMEEKWTQPTKMLNRVTSIARELREIKLSKKLYKYDQVMEYHRLLKVIAINDLRDRIRKKGSRKS